MISGGDCLIPGDHCRLSGLCVNARVHLDVCRISLRGYDQHCRARMSGCLDLRRIELDQRLSCLYMVSLFHKEFESVSAHVYCVNTHMDQKLYAVRQRKSAGMACISHHNAYVTVCRCSHYSVR